MPRKARRIDPEFQKYTKLGPLTADQMEYIDEHMGDSNEDIARQIQRTPNSIKKYKLKGHFERKKKDTNEIAQCALESKPFYKSLTYQFEDHELQVFKYEWAKFYIEQFKGDVQPTEELALVSLITTNILLNRNMVERKELLDQEKVYKRDLKTEYETSIEDRNNEWVARVSLLENQMATIRAHNKISTDERVKLEGQRNTFLGALRATREQRLKNSLEGSTNWPSLLRAVDEREFREREGRQAALVNIAAMKEREKLSKPFLFADNSTDLPILNSETVKNLEEKEEEDD